MKLSRSGRSIQRPLKYIESHTNHREEADSSADVKEDKRYAKTGPTAIDLSTDSRLHPSTNNSKSHEQNRNLPETNSSPSQGQGQVVETLRINAAESEPTKVEINSVAEIGAHHILQGQSIKVGGIVKVQKNPAGSESDIFVNCEKSQSKREVAENVSSRSSKKQKVDGESCARPFTAIRDSSSQNAKPKIPNLLHRRPPQPVFEPAIVLGRSESREEDIDRSDHLMDRGIDQSIDRQNLEHNMERQNFIIQENQRLTLEEQLALLNAGHQIQTDSDTVVLGQAGHHRKPGEDLDLGDQMIQPEVMLINEEGIEITMESGEPADPLDVVPGIHRSQENNPEPKIFPIWYQKLSSMLVEFLDVENMVDVVLQGEDGGTVPAHQVILGHVSPLLADLLREARQDCPEETLSILLPSTKTFVIRELIYSLYTGNLPTDRDTRLEVWNLAALLGLPLEYVESKSPDVPDQTLPQEKLFIEEENLDAEDIKAEEAYLEEEPMELMGDSLQETDTSSFEAVTTDSPSFQPVSTSEPQLIDPSSQPKVIDTELNTLLGKKEKTSLEKDQDPKASEILVMENQNVQVVQTETGEILILTCENSNINSETIGPQESQDVTSPYKNFKDQIRDLQNKSCELCKQSALAHRIEAEDRNVYICCRVKCTNSIIKSVRSFHEHVHKHKAEDDNSSEMEIKYEPADKPCPLCFKPRIEHKNRDIADPDKGNHKGNLYKCCHCSASRLTAKKFFTHLENHVSKKHVCHICRKGYSYKHLLEEHVWKMHGEGQFLWLSCPYDNCDYKARYKQTLHTHVNEHHKGVVRKQTDANKKVTCPNCKKVLMKWYYNLHHSKTCSQGNLLYKCEVCGKEGFINRTTLQNHVRLKHSEERPYSCEYCPNKYATTMSLTSHRSRKHGVNSRGEEVPRRVFPCSICNKLLTSSIKLKSHIEVIHEGRRDFNCKFCGKSFTSKSNLQIHEGSQHTGILPYNCLHCQKSFGRKQQLRTHIENVHQDAAQTVDEPAKQDSVAQDETGTEVSLDKVDYAGTHVITEEQLDDGHFYVVNDMEAVHGVQVGDVIIPMELVDHESSVEISVPVEDQSVISHP